MKNSKEPVFVKIFEKNALSFNGTFADLTLTKPHDDFPATCNIGRRVSIKSTGSHKFTVINYGKNASLNNPASLEQASSGGSDANVDSRRPNELCALGGSGIWMGKRSSERDGGADQAGAAECKPISHNNCYQCKNLVIEEAVEGDELTPGDSFKSCQDVSRRLIDIPSEVNENEVTITSCGKDYDSPVDEHGAKVEKKEKEQKEKKEQKKTELCVERNPDVVLQIEDFSDDALDANEEIPCEDALLKRNSKTMTLGDKRTSQGSLLEEDVEVFLPLKDHKRIYGTREAEGASNNNQFKIPFATNNFTKRFQTSVDFTETGKEFDDSAFNTCKQGSPLQQYASSLLASDSSVEEQGCVKKPTSQVTHWRDVKLAKIGRIYCKRNKLRLVQQNGDCNVVYSKVDRRGVRYLNDLYTTLMEIKWRYIISVYLLSFLLSWNMFALLWWSIHILYGVADDGTTCVLGLHDFKTALLFSIETQSTIGYGSRAVTDMCPPAFLLLMIQTVFGAVSQCIATGLIFSKLARPSRRAETIIFSKNAVICSRDDFTSPENSPDYDADSKDSNNSEFLDEGHLNLEFRVGDVRNSQLIGVRISAILVKKNFIQNGRQVELKQERLLISTESEDDFYFLAWPITVIHRIDHKSPFWGTTSHHLALAEFEILIVLEANCESTGGTLQVKTSYLPSEIVWGARLEPLFTRPKYNGKYTVDYSRFHQIIPDPKMISEEEIENIANLFDTKLPKRTKFRFSFRESSVPFKDGKAIKTSKPLKLFSRFKSKKKNKKKVSYQYNEDDFSERKEVDVEYVREKTIFHIDNVEGENSESNLCEQLIEQAEPSNGEVVKPLVIPSDDSTAKHADSYKGFKRSYEQKVSFGNKTSRTSHCLYPLAEQHSDQPAEHSKYRSNHQANNQQLHHHSRHHQQHHHSHHQTKKFTAKPSYISLQSYDSLPSLAYEDLSENDQQATTTLHKNHAHNREHHTKNV